MSVRTYRPADLERCRELWAELVQQHRDIYEDGSIGGDDPGQEFDQHLALVGPERVWVASEGERIVGLTGLILDGQEAQVEPVVVASGHRGGGVGRALVEHAVQQARALGVLCLCVKPVARNEAAVTFFHDAGFRTLGHLQLFMWLGPSLPGQWKPGPTLLGKAFDY